MADATYLLVRGDGNVGIGTTSPTRRLHIKSAANNASQIGLIDVDSTNEVFRVGQQSDGDGFTPKIKRLAAPIQISKLNEALPQRDSEHESSGR